MAKLPIVVFSMLAFAAVALTACDSPSTEQAYSVLPGEGHPGTTLQVPPDAWTRAPEVASPAPSY